MIEDSSYWRFNFSFFNLCIFSPFLLGGFVPVHNCHSLGFWIISRKSVPAFSIFLHTQRSPRIEGGQNIIEVRRSSIPLPSRLTKTPPIDFFTTLLLPQGMPETTILSLFLLKSQHMLMYMERKGVLDGEKWYEYEDGPYELLMLLLVTIKYLRFIGLTQANLDIIKLRN